MHTVSPAILAIGTALPRYQASQEAIGRWMADSFTQRPAAARLLRSIYKYTGIETRYTCIPDFVNPVEESRFAPGRPLDETPTTAERMAIYERESVPLGTEAASRALAELAAQTETTVAAAIASITHLVVISCTGFFAPGLDLAIAKRLDLPPTVGRTLIGFMGCSAMFNGLRTAHQIVCGAPTARVLVVSVELCSLHIQPGTRRENVISASLFADGSSACVVGAPSVGQKNVLVLEQLRTEVKPDTRQEMVWQIGDHGFELILSPRIPRHLGEVAPRIVTDLFPTEPPTFYAVHPGGPAILDELEEMFDIDDDALQASRNVLRDYGNLSSATILFVLDQIRRDLKDAQTGVTMAFGPGLTVEMIRAAYHPTWMGTSRAQGEQVPALAEWHIADPLASD